MLPEARGGPPTEVEAERRLAGSTATGGVCGSVYGGRRDPSFCGRRAFRGRGGKRIGGSRPECVLDLE